MTTNFNKHSNSKQNTAVTFPLFIADNTALVNKVPQLKSNNSGPACQQQLNILCKKYPTTQSHQRNVRNVSFSVCSTLLNVWVEETLRKAHSMEPTKFKIDKLVLMQPHYTDHG